MAYDWQRVKAYLKGLGRRFTARPRLALIASVLALASLTGCVNTTALDRMATTQNVANYKSAERILAMYHDRAQATSAERNADADAFAAYLRLAREMEARAQEAGK